ncbi:hypothetical protein LOD99_16066 [Oopsacas minuta]|uniref:Heparan-sulfate 6-O-sulfotransferase n=1 Tax=Oopsacas minuta TaxID=111878 RepID=A0AAV7K6P5_9METZ|nr:hypothetical protein LOD99_16066 [Oopsacas minuta]
MIQLRNGNVPPGYNITHPGDIIVFFHIQKTAGSFFEDKLVNNISNYSCAGEKLYSSKKSKFVWRHYHCYKSGSVENWIFTRRTVGWPCGVHADFITLKTCARMKLGKDKNLFFVTSLRHPVSRFLSEYLHVKRGANWPVYEIDCSRESIVISQTQTSPKCRFFSKDLGNLTLQEFMNCTYNPAINRMTYMLAGYYNIKCELNYTITQAAKESIILETAKRNLEEFTYFGIFEFLKESYQLFESIFSVKFMEIPTLKENRKLAFTIQELKEIEEINYLDIQLYSWAVELFKKRLKSLKRIEI